MAHLSGNKRKPQRVRDPVHNLVSFDDEEFEGMLWEVIQTAPFQRLRRIRQLGFSEFVYPGATHTRFAHSLGVFHIARQLMGVIKSHAGTNFSGTQAKTVLAAALLHDVGHGMFSHAFEAVGKEFSLKMAKHEAVSEQLIRDGEIAECLKALGSGFPNDVADVIARKEPKTLYDAVVSSQFDADRLDYMQRDRLMTGVQTSGLDFTWLLANLEIASVSTGADDEKAGSIETLALGPKALQTAESYVLSLFHLYPNVYLHKTTRGVELLFQAMIRRLISLQKNGSIELSGLPQKHPILQFVMDPESLDKAQKLDDAVFWGALSLLAEAQDPQIMKYAQAIQGRKLLRCIDIRAQVETDLLAKRGEDRKQRRLRVAQICDEIFGNLEDVAKQNRGGNETIFLDRYERPPYKRYEGATPLNRILIRYGGRPHDVADVSPIIASAEPFNLWRAYVFKDDHESSIKVSNEIRTKIKKGKVQDRGERQ